jgi:hypothetical protein
MLSPLADATFPLYCPSDSSMIMKYALALGFAICTIIVSAAGQETDAERAGFRGRVKFVERYETYFCCTPNQRRRLPRRLTGTTTFNRKGGYVEWVSINNTSDGPYYTRRVFKYDERGRRIGAEEYRSDKNPPETYFELARDADGSAKLTPKRAEKLTERIKYTLDEDGRIVEEVSRDANENLILRKVYRRDDEGNIIHAAFYKEGGVLDNESIILVSGGNRFETTHIRPGTEVQRTVYERDERGRTLWGEAFGLKTIGEKGARWISLNRSRHNYSDGGDRMDWIINKPDGSPNEKIIILSDDRGETLSRVEFKAGPLPAGSQNEGIEPAWTMRERTQYHREYDRKGNALRTETREQSRPELPLELTNIYESLITYY